MILEKELYNSINGSRSILRSIAIYSINSFRSIFAKDIAPIKARPRKLLSLSSIEGCSECTKCEVICPTNCLEVKSNNEKLESMKLDLRACTFCGLCVDVCPSKYLDFADTSVLSSHGESSWVVDLVQLNEK
jgi:formate hydrogenlyase subunit 6/NADH:ubiquinone oxidoreductase subunit I